MKKILLLSFIVFSSVGLYSQVPFIKSDLSEQVKLKWINPMTFADFDETSITLLQFKEATYSFPSDSLPYFSQVINLPAGSNDAFVDIEVLESQPLSTEEQKALKNKFIPNKAEAKAIVSWYRKKPLVTIKFTPIYKDPTTQEIFKVISFNYKITPKINRTAKKTNQNFKVNSVLRSGNWVKIGVTKDGIYKISFTDLKSMGINTDGLSSSQLRLFGNGGGYLPFENSKPRFDDLEENAIEIFDGGDGNFNSGDYLLFYGQDPNRWVYNLGRFNHKTHLFSDTTYYFITADYSLGNPKRIIKTNPISQPATVTVSTFTDHQFHEVDLLNFVKSGRNWYGESYSFTKSRTLPFSFPNAITNTAQIKARMAFRVIRRASYFDFTVNGNNILKVSHAGVSGAYYGAYAGIAAGINSFTLPSESFDLTVKFSNPSSSDNAWMDYVEIVCDRQLKMTGAQMPFRNTSSKSNGIIQYNLSNISGARVWNVTSQTSVTEVPLSNSNFKANGGQINEFIAFTSSNYLSVKSFGKVANQDLHGIQNADYVIVTHPNFLNQANQ